jgi:hypothetical protein
LQSAFLYSANDCAMSTVIVPYSGLRLQNKYFTQ